MPKTCASSSALDSHPLALQSVQFFLWSGYMAVSLNSVFSFNPYARCRGGFPGNTRKDLVLRLPKLDYLLFPVRRSFSQGKISGSAASDGDNFTEETESKTLQESIPNPSELSYDESFVPSEKVGLVSETSSKPNRAPLTARERLRAARVLSRYTESKAPVPKPGNKMPDLLQASEQDKKRSGLPQAPTDLLDDTQRGLSKQGWTIDIIPGGTDVAVIIFSFVFISTVMFATTYIVWKSGAIHFNEL